MKLFKVSLSATVIIALLSCSNSSDEMTFSSKEMSSDIALVEMELEERREEKSIASAPTSTSAAFSAQSGGEGVDALIGGLMNSGRQLQDRSSAVQLNQIISQSFYADSRYARERYLAYSISLKYVSQDFSYSREQLFKALEKYGFLVDSNLEVNRNNCFEQTVNAKIKTDSLYRALEIFDEIGIVIEEKISVVDHTNRVSVPSGQASSKPELSEESDEEVVRDVRNISQTNIRDAVEWANFNITIEGVEPVVVYEHDDSQINGSIALLQSRVIALIGFIIENILIIVTGVIVTFLIRKGVVAYRSK